MKSSPLRYLLLPCFLTLVHAGDEPKGDQIPGLPSEVVGAYSETFAPEPLGTGFGFAAGFRLQDGSESAPIAFWVSKHRDVLVAVDSVSSINRVFYEVAKTRPRWPDSAAIHVARLLISEKVRNQGPTGIPLTMNGSDLSEFSKRLRSSGLDENTAKLIMNLGALKREYIDSAHSVWSSEWYEIDSCGGIERVTVKGTLNPVKVVSILHENAYAEGTVNPGLLRRYIFVDINLSR